MSEPTFDDVEYKGFRYRIPKKKFDPEGDDFDYNSAFSAGMEPVREGPNVGHLSTVVRAGPEITKKYKLPEESYLVLKGRKHESWSAGVQAEADRGFKVIKLGKRYFSVPKEWMP